MSRSTTSIPSAHSRRDWPTRPRIATRADLSRQPVHQRHGPPGELHYQLRDDNIWTKHRCGDHDRQRRHDVRYTELNSRRLSAAQPAPYGWQAAEYDRTTVNFSGQDALCRSPYRACASGLVDPQLELYAQRGLRGQRLRADQYRATSSTASA